MKRKGAIITFHASHNYGSMLQAYALQKALESIGEYCEILNFRTIRQKKFYEPIWRQGTLYERFKRFVLLLPFRKDIKIKYERFESFIIEELCLSSKEYNSLLDLSAEVFKYDYYISGSDQIWNTLILDFDWAYFLPFVKNSKRIAYAPSLGPTPELTSTENEIKIRTLLDTYDAISVREKRTAVYFKKLMDNDFPVVLDPTLLLSRNDWENFAGDEPLIKGDYCFCYSPWMNEKVLTLANKWATNKDIQIVVSKPFIYLSSKIRWRNVTTYLPVGPKEFLNLCKFAKIVCCDSFHAVVFSILFHTPFFALDGMEDARISNLLNITGMASRSVREGQVLEDSVIDFNSALSKISSYRVDSIEWLKNALNK